MFSIEEQLLRRIVKRFRGGLVFKAHIRLHHSTLGSRVIKKKGTTAARKGHCSADVVKNDPMAPLMTLGYPHEGPCVGSHANPGRHSIWISLIRVCYQ